MKLIFLNTIIILLKCVIVYSQESYRSGGYHDICNPKDGLYCSDPNGVCIDFQCQCKPNYVPDFEHNWTCIAFKCDNDLSCGVYDLNIICSDGKCICGKEFVEDPNNGGKCESRSCDGGCTGDHRLCADGQCHCEANYKWNLTSGQCYTYKCNDYIDCFHTWDTLRTCSDGKCVCYDSYIEDLSNGRKCIYYFAAKKWLWAAILFPALLLSLIITVIYYKCIKRRK